MNPNRDTAAAKADEENVAWILEYSTGAEIALMPEYSPFDFIAIRVKKGVRELSAIMEYRGRPDTRKHQYPTIVINAEKVKKINEMAARLGVEQTVFIVKWMDTEPEWVSLQPANWKIEHLTRKDEERPNDRTEPVYHIPVSQFKTF